MSTTKNESTPAKDGRDAAKASSPAAAPASYRARMSLEKKLGIAFIGALLTVFLVVLGVRLSNLDGGDEKVDINLSSETEETPPTAKPAPLVVAERTPAPLTPFNNSAPPQVKSPPTAYMPPAPAAATPATPNYATPVAAAAPVAAQPTRTSMTSPPPAAFATPSNTTGDRYASAPPPTAPTNAAAMSYGNPPPTDAANSNSGNPLRSMGSLPTATPNLATPATVNLPTPSPTTAASAPYATADNRYSSAATTSLPTATSPSRTPGVASLGATANGPSYSMPTAAPTPPPSAIATPTVMSTPVAAPLVAPPPPVAAAPQAKPHVVAPGESFWSIAQQAYGDGSYYRALFAYNSDRYPHAEDVRTGSVLDVPSVEVLKAKFPELCAGGAATVAAGGESPAMTGRANVAVAARTYIVQEGDTLFDIARRQLGKASYWSEIYNLNRAALGENLEQLKPGTELMLPAVQ